MNDARNSEREFNLSRTAFAHFINMTVRCNCDVRFTLITILFDCRNTSAIIADAFKKMSVTSLLQFIKTDRLIYYCFGIDSGTRILIG